jgi:hypothetical protein
MRFFLIRESINRSQVTGDQKFVAEVEARMVDGWR